MINNDKKCEKDTISCDTISLTTIHLYDIQEVPDGGYGWVIVLAAFCNNMVADGLTFSFGIIFYELMINYDESHFKTSLFTCLFNGIPLLCGPITSFLTEKYSCKIIAILGGYITHLGFFLSYFTTTFSTLFLTLSIIAPIGLSFVYIPSIVMVSRYFDKKRAFATGIAVSGSGVGAIVFSLLIEMLCSHYTLKGALLILSGIILHVCVFGLLFKPIGISVIDEQKAKLFQNEYSKFVAKVGVIQKKSETYSQISEIISTAAENEKIQDSSKKIEIHEKLINNSPMIKQLNINSNKCDPNQKTGSSKNLEIQRISVVVKSSTSASSQYLDDKKENSSSITLIKQPIFLEGIKAYLIQDHRAIFGKRKIDRGMQITLEAANDPKTIELHHKFVTKSRFQAKYFVSLLIKKRSHNIFKILWMFLSAIFDVSLLCKWTFSGMMFSNFILYACFPIAYNNLPEYALENMAGNTLNYPLLLGLGNCIGQIGIGYLGDRLFIQSIALYISALSISGICCLIIPIYKTYTAAYIVFSILFGFTISANFSLCSVVLVDIFGIEKLTSTYGMVLFGQGMGCLFGPGLSGYLRDINETYDFGFMFSGFGILFSNLILIPLMVKKNLCINSCYNGIR